MSYDNWLPEPGNFAVSAGDFSGRRLLSDFAIRITPAVKAPRPLADMTFVDPLSAISC
jgi:hypothetical protein